MKVIIGLFFSIISLFAYAQNTAQKWEQMNMDQRSEILIELDYLDSNELPLNTVVIDYLEKSVNPVSVDSLTIQNPDHLIYVRKIISVFESEVSTEDIEQSEYSAFGDPTISELYLLVDDKGNVLGSKLSFYQDGRDQDGNEADVNWYASVRFDENAEILTNENGESYDELYFEWSGH